MARAAASDEVVTETPSAAGTGELAEIIVTAQKRSQKLMDVGLTVAAASRAQLQDAGVTDITQLSKVVSGFQFANNFNGLPVFTIRGLGFNASQISAAPTVSVYVDEAPLPYLAMTGGTILDLERVEVLKGPQGTLFGNNSTGGSVNFVAAKPTDTFSAGVQSSVDQFGQFYAETFVSGPLSDKVQARVAASTAQGGAWQHTYSPGPSLTNGNADKGAERAIIDWEPDDDLKIELNLNSYYDDSDPQLFQFSGAHPDNPAGVYVDPRYGSIVNYPLPPENDGAADWPAKPGLPISKHDIFYQAVLRTDYALTSDIKLTSITNYAHLNTAQERSFNGVRIDIEDEGLIGHVQTYAEELRMTGDFRDIGLNVIAGGNYSHDSIQEEQPNFFPHFSALPTSLTLNSFENFGSKTAAAFANAEWKATNQVTLTGGLRYTQVQQSDEGCTPDNGSGQGAAFLGGLANAFRSLEGLGPTQAYVPGGCITIGPAPDYLPFYFRAENTESNLSWRGGVNDKVTNDLLLYVLASRGYKAGAYPFGTSISSSQYDRVKQEEVTAYEGGIKYSFGRRLNLTAAYFYYDYINKQAYTLIPVPLFAVVSTLVNIPKSKAHGIDAELTYELVTGLTLHDAVTYLRTAITNPGPLGLDTFGNPINLVGHPFPYAPQWSDVFGIEYRRPISANFEGFIGLSGLYNSHAYADPVASAPFYIKSYTTLDARLGIDHSNWTATAWVRNLMNTYYWTYANFDGEGFVRTTGMPRDFGISIAYRF